MSLYTKNYCPFKKNSVLTNEIQFKFQIQVKFMKTYNKNIEDQFYYIMLRIHTLLQILVLNPSSESTPVAAGVP